MPVNPFILGSRSFSSFDVGFLAGPLSNLGMAVLAAIPFRMGLASPAAAFLPSETFFPSLEKILYEFVTINLLLMLFNLIPLAPLEP